MSDQVFWYVTRSSALIAWMAAAASILVGLMIPSRLLGRRPSIPWLTDLHRMLGALASVFVLVHMVSLWLDHFVQFRWADLLVPWVATVPGLSRTSLALGVIAAWLMAAVELTSLVRDRLSPALWRSVHLTSYAVLVLGTFHAVLAGSDVGHPIAAAIGVSTLTAVILATVVRLRRPPPDPDDLPTPAHRPDAPIDAYPPPVRLGPPGRLLPPLDAPAGPGGPPATAISHDPRRVPPSRAGTTPPAAGPRPGPRGPG